jgi:hypothetical protein
MTRASSSGRALLLLLVVECLVLYTGYIPGANIDGILTVGRSYDNTLLPREQSTNVNDGVATNTTATTLSGNAVLGRRRTSTAAEAPVVSYDHDDHLLDQNSTSTGHFMLQQMAFQYESNIQHLRNLSLRYYVYDDWPALQLVNHSNVLSHAEEPYVFSAFC